jgi:hypothetical protein
MEDQRPVPSARRWPDHHPYFSEIVAVIQKYLQTPMNRCPIRTTGISSRSAIQVPKAAPTSLAAGLYSAIVIRVSALVER